MTVKKPGLVVIKAGLRKEPFDFTKIEKVVKRAAEGLNVDVQKLYQKLSLPQRGEVKSTEIQRSLVAAATALVVTEENKEDYSTLAARLLLVHFKKQMRLKRQRFLAQKLGLSEEEAKRLVNRYGLFERFEHFALHVRELVKKGLYHPLLEKLLSLPATKELYEELLGKGFKNPLWQKGVRHSQVQKFIRSYLIEEGSEPVELPEEVWFLQSLMGFALSLKLKGEEHFKRRVRDHFEHLAGFRIVPATPQMLNLRRAKANLSSCFILDVKDNTESIVHTQSQIAQISRNAGGVGLYLGRLRPSGGWIKGNPGKANKVTDWVKIYEATVNAFNQQGKRKGSITVALPVWHKDLLDFLEVIDLDVGEIPKKSPDVFTQVVLPEFFFRYHNQKGYVWLIDHHELTEVLGRKDLNLVEASGEALSRRYDEVFRLAEEGKLKNAKKVSTAEILRKIFYYWGRKGLPYVFFEDNANLYSPFEEKVYSANLCMENFSPFNNTDPDDLYCIPDEKLGYVHTCNITNVNLYRLYVDGILFDDEKLKNFVEHLYEYADNLIELTDVPVKESKRHNHRYRTVTAGFMGLADVFVLHSLKTGRYHGYRFKTRKGKPEDTLSLIDKIFGRFALFAVEASVKLAAERGRAPAFKDTRYKDGVILGRYDLKDPKTRQKLDALVGKEGFSQKLYLELKKHGIRNTLLLNCPPNTSTSILAGVSAGVMPVFNVVHVEDQQTGAFVHFAPLYKNALLYDPYARFCSIEDFDSLTDVVARIQSWIDAGISFELVVNHNCFDTPEKLTRLYASVLSFARKKGVKGLYYWRHVLKDKSVTSVEECESCAN